MPKKFGVTAIGNAIVDILAATSDEFIAAQKAYGMEKGGMMLIDAERAEALYAQMGPATEMSGGSAGNTMAAYASFGGTGAYIGKVAADQLGEVFRHDTRAIGVEFATAPLENDAPTARSFIFVTPDAQRTMNTYLGACVKLTPADIDEDLIAQSEIVYLEGYLFDQPDAKAAFFKAADLVKKHGGKLSLTLSDSFCVHRYRDEFLALIRDHIDILFANDDELKALFQTESLDDAITAIRPLCDIVALTMGEKGSKVIAGDQTFDIAAIPPAQLVDTTGAGDAYAAGFLFGLTSGADFAECGRLGSLAASEVISHMGPRPLASLHDLSKKAA